VQEPMVIPGPPLAEPGIYFPEARLHGFRALGFAEPRNDTRKITCGKRSDGYRSASKVRFEKYRRLQQHRFLALHLAHQISAARRIVAELSVASIASNNDSTFR